MKPNNTELRRIFSSFFENILSSLEESPTKAKVTKKWTIFSSLLNSPLDDKVLADYVESLDDVSKELYFLQICQSSAPLNKTKTEGTRSTFFTSEENKKIDTIYESQMEDFDIKNEGSFILNRDRIMSNEEKRFNYFKGSENNRYGTNNIQQKSRLRVKDNH